MGLPLPWLQPGSPRRCPSPLHSLLTGVTVQLKRYNKFRPNKGLQLSVMSIVTEPALINADVVFQKKTDSKAMMHVQAMIPNCLKMVNLQTAINL